jgi:preprotein translocase subunit YajC
MDAQISFDKPLVPITEIVTRPDFPHSAVGEFVDIGGFTGVIVEVIQNSIRIASPEGFTRRFNHYRLRELYGPRPEPEPISPPAPEPVAEAAPPPRTELQELNFDREVRPIREYFDRSGYPQCLLGELVDVGGYVGVVVSVEDDSIKVRSQQGTSRKYNATVLPKLQGGTPA